MPRTILCVLLPLFLCWTLPARAEVVTVAINLPTLEWYNQLVTKQHYDLECDGPIPAEGVSRPIIDLLILHKALHLGGLDPEFEFVVVPNIRRELEHLAVGLAMVGGQQMNRNLPKAFGYAEDFYVSPPVSLPGEFQKGFYCLESNKRVLGLSSLEALRTSTLGILGRHWLNDAQVLTDMGLTNVLYGPTFASMVKMVVAGRADWMPLEIPNSPDLSISMCGVRFVPIPGLKFSLLESRHFFVSKKNPQGKRVAEALQQGIAALREQGYLRKALERAGFFNPQAASWTLLNADAVKRVSEEIR